MLSSTLSSKGQVTIPIAVRQRLGLQEGDQVEFVFENDKTIVRPLRPPENPFLQYVGALSAFASIEEINAWVRGMRGDLPEAE